jgi:site-specific recombinase XerC
MDTESQNLKMLEYLFGEAAPTAQRAASPRLLRWCRAFDDWLAEGKQRCQPTTIARYMISCKRLLDSQGKLPWELSKQDIEQHMAWMKELGYSQATISVEISCLAVFFTWCDKHQIDPECEAGFDPTSGIDRNSPLYYENSRLLSSAELDKLMGLMRRDETPLGKRDYAFVLLRLSTGVPTTYLQKLRWEKIESEVSEAWVRWRPERERYKLDGEAWQAILSWLKASGRLEGMQAGKYVFAPPARLRSAGQDHPQDWLEGKAIRSGQLLGSLQLYGRYAGVRQSRLNLVILRNTAIRLKMESGEDLHGMQCFKDTRSPARETKYALARLPELPKSPGTEAGEGLSAEQIWIEEEPEALLPDRKPEGSQAGDGMTHGYYARRQPPESLIEIANEEIHGIDEQIVGLRRMERGLYQLLETAHSGKEAAQLMDAQTLTAARLATMMEAEKQLSQPDEQAEWVQDVVRVFDEVDIEHGEEPKGMAGVLAAMGEEEQLAEGARRLQEEIAATRLVLRRMLALAGEAEHNDDRPGFIQLVDFYGKSCQRLVRLLKIDRGGSSRVAIYLHEFWDRAIEEASKEWEKYYPEWKSFT